MCNRCYYNCLCVKIWCDMVSLVDSLLVFMFVFRYCVLSSILMHVILFQTCSLVPYLALVHKTGLSVGPFQLRWYTTSLNRLILKMSFWHPRFQTCWFTFGSWITICLIVPSICLVIVSSVQLFKKILTEPNNNELSAIQQDIILEPVVRFYFLFNSIVFSSHNVMFLGAWIEFTNIRYSLLCTSAFIFNCFP